MTKNYRVSAGKHNVKLRQTDVQPLSGNGRDVPWVWPTMYTFECQPVFGRTVCVMAISQSEADNIYSHYVRYAK
jgi:hypothetical protein